MLKKTITYENWDGVEVTEDFYFNLTKSELLFMETSEKGGFKAKLLRIINSKDQSEIMQTIREFILASYGEKSPDGRKFMKSKEIASDFESTAAYDALMTELLLGEGAEKRATDFIEAILPKVADDNAKPKHLAE